MKTSFKGLLALTLAGAMSTFALAQMATSRKARRRSNRMVNNVVPAVPKDAVRPIRKSA